MKNLVSFLVIILIFGFSSCQTHTVGPAKVELKKNETEQYRLFVNGNEFYVKGAGIEYGNITLLAQNGGNSFRTWSTNNGRQKATEVLDEALENGLMVLMGLEVGRQRHGYDYGDTAWVNNQFKKIITEVEELKHHPALLGWAIGNELNLGQEDLRIYDAVNALSEKIHEIDPYHVTTTTLAGIGKREVDYIKNNCNDIDFLSIQYYGEIENLHKHIENAGWKGPYMITEWGVTGHWEVERTDWNVAIEPTSQEKAKSIINRYDIAIASDKINCLGSYIFLWGQKQERTPTWYGMFTENGYKLETVDAMHYIWNGKWPEDRCPTIDSFRINKKSAYSSIKLNKQDYLNSEVFFRSYENDSTKFLWEIMRESTDLGWGGDFESKPEVLFSEYGKAKISLKVPTDTGSYRLFVYVSDNNNNTATANIPFYVKE